jgi:hypothetical protein
MKLNFSWLINLLGWPKAEVQVTPWPFPAPCKPKVAKATTRKPAVKKVTKKTPTKVVKKKVIKVKK